MVGAEAQARVAETNARAQTMVAQTQAEAASQVAHFRMDAGSRAESNVSYASTARVRQLEGEMETMRSQNEALLNMVQKIVDRRLARPQGRLREPRAVPAI